MPNAENTSQDAAMLRTMTKLDARLEVLHQDVAEVKGAMHKLADAITKLAVIEERQSQVSSAVERAFASISAAQAQIASIEVRMATALQATSASSKWIDRALVGLVALGAGYVAGGR